ncbi:hypothetical protein Taro_020943 [Colocasia esculenta]|uniref:DUF4110 domain-containing protein n=1 Tax=Colocasia esculenta TaxID=4460 RepID=A0A843UXN5_COLES|nr:hypothetical protein [Colocasia esculenta]
MEAPRVRKFKSPPSKLRARKQDFSNSSTPEMGHPGETLKDFYRRTNLYWQMAAHEHTQHTGKELRKDGFDLAEARFKELKPVLDELAILEAEQKAEEEESAESSTRKKNSKKSDHQISRR